MSGMPTGIERRWFLVAGLALAGAVSASAFARAEAASGPAQFIESLADKAVAALTDKNIRREERVRRFRVLLNDHFAVEIIARWVLGRPWATANVDERAEYLRLFEDLIVYSYVDRFTEYAGEKLEVLRTVTIDGGDTMVYSSIVRGNQPEPVEVDWRVRTRDGKFKIVDVMVKGISMGVTQRQEFASVFSRNNNSMSAFLAELRERVKKGV
jgi:phospholipid transport system substrate-binding protein